MSIKILFLITIIKVFSVNAVRAGMADDPIVTVQQGSLHGAVAVSAGGRTYYQFRGIPYAKPPLGELRFQPPVNADNWDGIRDATQDANDCIQWWGDGITGVEDCLYLYVYTPFLPNADTNVSLPVLAYIHGGSFDQGGPQYSNFYPEGFMDYDVVMANIGYRLGPLGFFSTGDDASLGNYGMLDQVFALKWIQDNIAQFSGDKSRVTLVGESAGGSSVAYQVLSPASAGLFHGAISQSGSALCPWAFQKDPLPWAIQFAEQLNCPTNNTSILAECVSQQTAEDLVMASVNLNGYDLMVLPFVPVVENKVTGRFLTDSPLQILEEGTFNKVAVISGINKDEGDITYSYTQQYYTTIDDNFYHNILPQIIEHLTKYENNLINVSYAVKAEYFDKIDVTNQTQVIRTAIDLNSDPFFKAPCDYTIRKLADGGASAYMYAFEYFGSGSSIGFTGGPEISHGDELHYIFFQNRDSFTAQDIIISDALLGMWTSFAATLNPTPSGDVIWTPSTNVPDMSYLRIQDELSMQQGYLTERMSFWTAEVPKIVYG